MEKKKRTGDVLDVLLGRKKPAVLKKEKKQEVSLSDDDDENNNNNNKDVKPPKRLLHTVRQHPPKKVKNPYQKFSDLTGTGKSLDDSISEPLPTDGRAFIDEYMSVPNSCMKPKTITPTSYMNIRIHNRKQKKHEEKRLEEIKKKQKEEKKREELLDANNNDGRMTEEAEQRLEKELVTLGKNPPQDVVVNIETIQGKNLESWTLDLKGPKGTSYYGDRYTLQFEFGSKYPKAPPKVTFVGNSIPKHPQVTSEGSILLPMLDKEWSSTTSIRTICSALISMLLSEEDEFAF